MKKFMLKKVLALCAIATLSVGSIAQVKPVEPVKSESKNYLDSRTELLKRYGLNNALSLGWYTGVVDSFEVRESWSNYILLSNYLSEKLGRLVVVETSQSDREITKDAYDNMDVVYTSAVMGADLVKKGWRPIVGRSEPIQSVILVSEDTKISSPKDLKSLNILGVTGATVTYFALSSLVKDGVYTTSELKSRNEEDKGSKVNIQILNNRQSQLFELLKNKQAGGVITRETLANNYMKNNPGKFKIGYKAEVAPGHIVFVGPNVREETANQIKDALLALTPDNPNYKKILKGLDGYQENDKTPFKVVTTASLNSVGDVLKNIGESDVFVDKK